MNPIKLLIVDDNQDNIEILKYRLIEQNEKYKIIEATSGEQALYLIEKSAPDIVLLDIMMPGMDGYEVALQIKTKYSENFIPIIMITAREDLSSKIKGFESGGDDYIIKPFDISELMVRIESLLRIKELQDKLQRMNEKLIETEKFAAVGATVATLNHEINNPLCAIMLDIQMLLMSDVVKQLPKSVRRKIEKIETNAKRISEITQKLSQLQELSTKEYLEGARIIDTENLTS